MSNQPTPQHLAGATQAAEESPVIIYTDGACIGNPGPGGYGAVLSRNGGTRIVFGGEPKTTNNRMELRAVIEALKSLRGPSLVHLYSDSTYVINGITKWVTEWQRKGWKKVKNRDLWEALLEAAARHRITWEWVRGHAGNPGNERADAIANREAAKYAAA